MYNLIRCTFSNFTVICSRFASWISSGPVICSCFASWISPVLLSVPVPPPGFLRFRCLFLFRLLASGPVVSFPFRLLGFLPVLLSVPVPPPGFLRFRCLFLFRLLGFLRFRCLFLFRLLGFSGPVVCSCSASCFSGSVVRSRSASWVSSGSVVCSRSAS